VTDRFHYELGVRASPEVDMRLTRVRPLSA
jgi:hypothetical protein